MIEDEANPARGRGGRHHGGERAGRYVATRTDAIRQILVHVDESEAGAARLDLACHLAKAFDAEVLGVSCLPPRIQHAIGTVMPGFPFAPALRTPPSPFPRTTETNDSLLAWQRQMHATEEWFRLHTAKTHIRGADWRTIDYGGLREMLGLAKGADLTILGQHPPFLVPSFPGFAPEDITLASGRPTLVVPLRPGYERIGQVVAIAWDGSREAVRAVCDCMPLLRDAVRIVVVEVDPAVPDPVPESPRADAVRAILERHGFQAFVESRSAADGDIGRALDEAVTDLSADLLVAGLYHHSRLREGLFGGVSRDLVRRMTVPVLLSH